MKLGIGGSLGPFRAGVSTRGFGVGAGPFHLSSGYGRRRGSTGAGAVFAALLGLLLALAAIIVLLPLAFAAATIFGFMMINAGLRPQPPAAEPEHADGVSWERPARRPGLVWAGAALVAATVTVNVFYIPWLVHAVTHGTATSTADGGSDPAAATAMPILTGQRLDRAEDTMQHVDADQFAGRYTRLSDFDDNLEIVDLSRIDGDPMEYANWTVVSTAPAPGARLSADATVTLRVVRNETYTWYRKHPTMPRVHLGGTVAALGAGEFADPGGPLAPVAGLVTVRHSTPAEYRSARTHRSHGVIGTFPAAGQRLHPGQQITLLIAPRNH